MSRRLLLTNDDGIRAPGIVALHKALGGLGEIVTVAPLTVQSAASHGITYSRPMTADPVRVNETMEGIAIDGRPADCTKVALKEIFPERFGDGAKPDLTISGLNMGANVGINVIYSGTVAAAVESAFLGVPAIAVSLHLGPGAEPDYDRAAFFARTTIDRVLEQPLSPHDVININIPRTESAVMEMPQIKVVEMNVAPEVGRYLKRESPAGRVYYWADGTGLNFSHSAEGSDVEALFQKHITVTPLSYQLTDRATIDRWRTHIEG